MREPVVGRRPFAAVWVVTYPLLITGLIQRVLTTVDIALLGQFSTRALAGAALVAPVYIVATSVTAGWSTAAAIFVAQHYGAGERAEVGRVADGGLALSVATGAAVGVVAFALAPLLIGVLGADADLTGPAVTYLRILVFAVPVASAMFTLQSAFSGIGATRVAMYTVLVVNAVDIPLGVVMIFGLGWGVIGAGVSTVLGTVAGLGFMIWYGRRRVPAELGLLRWGHVSAWRSLVPGLWPVAWPETTWLLVGNGNEVILIGIIAQLGAVEVAAYQIVLSVVSLIATAALGCGRGVSILVGQRLGAGAPDEAVVYRRAGLRLAAMLVAVPTLVTLLFPELLFRLLTNDAAVLTAVGSSVALAALRLVPTVPALNLWGVLRAAGDTRTIMIASLVSDFLILVPLAWLLALPLGLGLRGVWLAWIGWWVSWLGWLFARYRQNTWRTRLVTQAPT